MEVILIIGTILILLKIAGEIFERIGLPAIFGEIGIGIILGPVLGIIELSSSPSEQITYSAHLIKILGEIGLVFLLFSIGFEKVEIGRLSGSITKAIPIAIFGAMLPFFGGFLVALLFSESIFPQFYGKGALLIGTALAATSIGVSLRTLMDLRYLATPAGNAILITAVIDSLTSLILLSVVMGIIQTGSICFYDITITLLKICVFALIVFFIGKYLFPILARLTDRMMVEEASLAIIIGILFVFSYLTDKIGLSTIVGAFLFGISISVTPRLKTETMIYRIRGISNGFFVPFFFLNIGLLFDFKSISDDIGIFGIMLIISLIISQIIGGFIGGKIAKFNLKDSLIIGVALIPRNELVLIIASVGLSLNIFTTNIFSTLVLLVIVSTLIAPLILRFIIHRAKVI
jgi:Kef-type K+ transport system membrane component KefB